MTNPVNAFRPAIDALEQDFADLERQGNALLTSINLLRSKAGLPPRPGGGGLNEFGPQNCSCGPSSFWRLATATSGPSSRSVKGWCDVRKERTSET